MCTHCGTHRHQVILFMFTVPGEMVVHLLEKGDDDVEDNDEGDEEDEEEDESDD